MFVFVCASAPFPVPVRVPVCLSTLPLPSNHEKISRFFCLLSMCSCTHAPLWPQVRPSLRMRFGSTAREFFSSFFFFLFFFFFLRGHQNENEHRRSGGGLPFDAPLILSIHISPACTCASNPSPFPPFVRAQQGRHFQQAAPERARCHSCSCHKEARRHPRPQGYAHQDCLCQQLPHCRWARLLCSRLCVPW